nr:hypothetical protein [Tanacetum cinerariifolium]
CQAAALGGCLFSEAAKQQLTRRCLFWGCRDKQLNKGAFVELSKQQLNKGVFV